MSESTGKRRTLSYNNWDEIVSDISVLRQGYEQVGKWNLSQAAKHLNDWVRFPIEGFPKAPWPIALLMKGIRYTIGPSLLKKVIREGKMADGGPTDPKTVYQWNATESEAEEISRLLSAIEQFRNHRGDVYDSPIFGTMSYETATRLQLVHFAHHLSWLVPKHAS